MTKLLKIVINFLFSTILLILVTGNSLSQENNARAQTLTPDGSLPLNMSPQDVLQKMYEEMVSAEVAGNYQMALLLASQIYYVMDRTHDDKGQIVYLANMALYLRKLGRYDQAGVFLNTALNKSTDVFGANDVLTAEIEGNLGTLYYTTGEYLRAESLFQQSLQKMTTLFGERDKRTIHAMCNVGSLYWALGRYSEA